MNMRSVARCLVLALLASAIGLTGACSAQTPKEQGAYRAFTDNRGRVIQARVVAIDGEQVTLERDDGRKFTLAVSILSAADQAYLRGLGQPAGEIEPAAKPKPPAENVAGADVWPSFRGPGGMGVAAASRPPVEWGADKNIAWKTALPGSGASSPIVRGDHIYLTCYTGYFVPGETSGGLDQLQRHLLALRRDNGEIAWDRAIPAKLPEEERVRDHGFAANTPAADAERVYAFFGKSGVFAFDHQGKQLWRADVGDSTSGWGSAASLLLHKDLVMVNASVESESLVALDRATGREKWRARGVRESWNTPVLVTAASGRKELVVARQGDVLAFDPDTGAPLWSCKTDIGWYMVPSGVAGDGVVYFLGGRSGTAALAVRAGGSGDVTATHRLWTSKKGSNVTSPIHLAGHLYWMSNEGGIAYCAKADTGDVVYEQRLERFGQVYASPVLADNRLYYFDRQGKAAVLAAKPEFEKLAINELGDRSQFDASPAVDGDRLLARSGKFLYCLQAK